MTSPSPCSSFSHSSLDPSLCVTCKQSIDAHNSLTFQHNFQPTTLFGEPARTKRIDLSFTSPHSQKVELRGSFDSWRNSYPMQREEGTDRFITCISLPEGRHQFKFVVDGVNWQCSDDYPKMRDATGHNVNNYCDVSFSE
ncbi:hypothetical protein RCL1_009151 [Eukaryota sp. TZLM3-RCL]